MENHMPEMPVEVPISTTFLALTASVRRRSMRPSLAGTLAYSSLALTASLTAERIRFSESVLGKVGLGAFSGAGLVAGRCAAATSERARKRAVRNFISLY